MLRKIIVAVDKSAAGDWAFDLALEMANALDAELILIHVLDVYSPKALQLPYRLTGSSMEIHEAAQEKYKRC